MRGKTILTEVNNRVSRRDAFCSEGPPFWGKAGGKVEISLQPSRGLEARARPSLHNDAACRTPNPHELAAARGAREGRAFAACSPPRPARRSAPHTAPRGEAPAAAGRSARLDPAPPCPPRPGQL